MTDLWLILVAGTVALVVAVGLFGLVVSVIVRRADRRSEAREKVMVEAAEKAQKYAFQVANIYGPISSELEDVRRRMDRLEDAGHRHPASVPVLALPLLSNRLIDGG